MQARQNAARQNAIRLFRVNLPYSPRRQYNRPARNSYLISAAPSKGTYGKWKGADTQGLLDHVHIGFLSNIQNNVGGPIKIMNYTTPRDINLEESAKASDDLQRESQPLSKDVLDFSKWIPYSYIGWTADEVTRLRDARGGRNRRFVNWASIVEYVGNGKTKGYCQFMWRRLCFLDDLLELSEGQEVSAVPKETDTSGPFGEWTPDEIVQLKSQLDALPDPRRFRMRIAYEMFPHKSRMHVFAKVRSLKGVTVTEKPSVRLFISQRMLVQLVSDYGGAKRADWRAVSKQCGVDVSLCQRIYFKLILGKYSNERWSSAEAERLLAALRSQRVLGGSYDWDAVSAAVVSRTRQQSFAWYVTNRPYLKRYLDRWTRNDQTYRSRGLI